MKTLFFTLFTFCALSSAVAAPAGYETQLIKLSKALKGEPPSLNERQELQQAIKDGAAETYLRGKTLQYLQDRKFSFKLKQKYDELVRVRTTLTEVKAPSRFREVGLSAYDILLQEIIDKNTSWDNILTQKKYATYFGNSNSFGEPDFFQNLLPQELERDLDEVLEEDGSYSSNGPEKSIYKFDFPADDQRVSGILTTQRFFNRYVNTALNKNRRRAAAVFRIFLCDTMIATAPTADASSEQKDYDIIFPDHKSLTEQDIRKSATGNIHGQQADCMKCHYKLDPLGQVFALSAVTVAPMASPGSLIYQGQGQRKVNIPLKGFGDLGQKITQQPEYVSCQVSHFWRWYIGKDVTITPAIEKELVEAFERVGRKPKDFVAYLVSRPEFKEKPQVLSEGQILAHRVTTTFKNCNSCHDSQGESVWDLTALPYGTDAKTRAEAIATLRKVLDVDHDGANAEMPPKSSLWKPSKEEFSAIKKWLEMGAPDFQGKPQVKPGARP